MAKDWLREAIGRRPELEARHQVRIIWFFGKFLLAAEGEARVRTEVATEYLKNKVIKNISKPVTKTVVKRKRGKGTYTKVTNRSKPGQYPKADTTQLMKSIFSTLRDFRDDVRGEWVGQVGTPLEYGLVLELLMDRSFLHRTLREEEKRLSQILRKRWWK